MTSSKKSDNIITSDINTYGWHVVKVLGDSEGPQFGYSIGFYESFGHSEIIIVGLDLDLIHSLINSMGESVQKGSTYKHGNFYPDLLQGYECYFTDVAKNYYDNYLGRAQVYYQNDHFPVLQCIYPTVKGIYPWDKNWPDEIKTLQPLLGESPPQ